MFLKQSASALRGIGAALLIAAAFAVFDCEARAESDPVPCVNGNGGKTTCTPDTTGCNVASGNKPLCDGDSTQCSCKSDKDADGTATCKCNGTKPAPAG